MAKSDWYQISPTKWMHSDANRLIYIASVIEPADDKPLVVVMDGDTNKTLGRAQDLRKCEEIVEDHIG